MKTHSPGPWHVDLDTTIASVKSADGKAVARCYQGDWDAALIAAAPAMLEALQACESALASLRKNNRWDAHPEDFNDDVDEAVDAQAQARAAIDKATN
jgi:hypothetical protein